MLSNVETTAIKKNDEIMKIEDYDSDKDIDFSFDLYKTSDCSNRNVNSAAKYSLLGVGS